MKSKYLSKQSEAGNMLRKAACLIAEGEYRYTCNAVGVASQSSALVDVYARVISPRDDGTLCALDFGDNYDSMGCAAARRCEKRLRPIRNHRVIALLFAALYVDDLYGTH